jgi:hypothetical protein
MGENLVSHVKGRTFTWTDGVWAEISLENINTRERGSIRRLKSTA